MLSIILIAYDANILLHSITLTRNNTHYANVKVLIKSLKHKKYYRLYEQHLWCIADQVSTYALLTSISTKLYILELKTFTQTWK